jgi:DNA polymerase delta subunit 1
MVVFQVLTWETEDKDDQHLVHIFGKTQSGKSICLTTHFAPYFFIKLPTDGYDRRAEIYYDSIRQVCPGLKMSYDIQSSMDVWGFQNSKKFYFMKLNFDTLANRRKVGYMLKRHLKIYEWVFDIVNDEELRQWKFTGEEVKLKLYESNLDPVLRLMHITGIQSTGWLDSGSDCTDTNYANTDIDITCSNWKKLKPVDKPETAPFVVASLDIECNSSTGKFPDAEILGDCCFQIAVSLCYFGTDVPYNKTCFCYKQTNSELEGCTILSYDSERKMLEAFSEYMVKMDIDIITGWNIFGFDMNYIMTRANMVRCSSKFYEMSKLKGHTCEMKVKKLSSSALGDNELKLLPIPGRFIFDMFHEVKKGYKLDSYKLDNVSKLYLGDQKIDMPAKEMFARFREGDPVKLREVAEYCIKDTLLPHKLLSKLCTLINLLEMAKATWVPLCYLVERGQQIKVFSQLTKKAREMGYIVPTIEWGQGLVDGYEGATVLEAQKGAYYTPITALDFEALYPSIMVGHNLCYSTLIMDPVYENKNLYPDLEIETFGNYKFVQNVPSLIPNILTELKQFRKQAKKDMANSTGSLKEMYNGKQLAYKISMNSVYGFTGASKGILPCVPIASSTTMKGRMMIEDTKNYVEKHYPGAKVRYGDTDSVMVEFDVGERKGEEAIKYSWELGERAAEECTKLFKKPNNLELEKVYYPYFLYSKKRYAAKLWTQGKDGKMNMDCIDVKGLQLVRRDNTPYMREVSKELLDVILESNNTSRPKALALQRAIELLEGDVPNEKLIISQQLGDSYKSDNLPHVQVRNKMRDRQPGSEPQSGDRVPYILCKTWDPRAKAYEKAEDPKYAVDNKMDIDYPYYFLNKFINPICDLIEPLFENPKEEIFGELITRSKPEKRSKLCDYDPKQKRISDIFKLKK